MVNHDLKCIFIHIIKTGGVSIATGLKMRDKQCHFKASQIKSIVGDEAWKTYFKFTFIRNPWDKMVSSYHFNHRKWVPEGTTFGEYIQAWGNGQQITRFPPQHSDYLDEEIDFIGRFENLNQDYNYILKQIGLPSQELNHLNQSKHKHYKDYYTEQTKNIVMNKFSKDIDIWGFKY